MLDALEISERKKIARKMRKAELASQKTSANVVSTPAVPEATSKIIDEDPNGLSHVDFKNKKVELIDVMLKKFWSPLVNNLKKDKNVEVWSIGASLYLTKGSSHHLGYLFSQIY